MSVTIAVDRKLLLDAQKLSGIKDKHQVVALGLRTLIALQAREKIKSIK